MREVAGDREWWGREVRSWSAGYPLSKSQPRQGNAMNKVSCSELYRRRAVVSMCQWCSSTRDWRRERGVFWSETLGDRDYLVLKLDWLALPHHHQILLLILQQHGQDHSLLAVYQLFTDTLARV